MSCGPDLKQLKAIDAINNAVEVTDKAIAALPKKIATIPGYAEVQLLTQINQDLKNLKEIIDDPLALAEAFLPSLPTEFANYIAAGNALAGDSASFLKFADDLQEKYGDFDFGDPQDILEAVNGVGGDIDKLCQVVPNIQKRKDQFIKKGAPISGSLNQIANPIKHQKLPSLQLIKDYADSFNSQEAENQKEVEVSNEEQKRFTMGSS